MWTNGLRLERHEVETWIQQAYAFPYFLASVREVEEESKSQVRVIITITGPKGERLSSDDKQCTSTYYSTRAIPGMPQIESEFVV